MSVVSDYFTQLKAELEDSSSSGLWTDTQLMTWTNDAIRDVGERVQLLTDWEYMTTVSGQMSYQLPAYTVEALVVRLSYLGGLRTLTRQDFGRWRSLHSTGTPQYYSVQDDAMYLYPVPNVTATIDFFRSYYGTPLSSVSATSDMPYGGRYDQMFRNYAKARAYEQLQDFDTASQFDNIYMRDVETAAFKRRRQDAADGENAPRTVW